MSLELDDFLNFDTTAPAAEPAEPVKPEPAPQPEGPSKEDVEKLKSQIALQEQKNKDLARLLSGEGDPETDNAKIFQDLVTKPGDVIKNKSLEVANEVSEPLKAEIAALRAQLNQQIIEGYKQRMPEYAEYEDVIGGMYDNIQRHAVATQGKSLDFGVALEAAVQNFKERFGNKISGSSQAVNHQSYRFDTGKGTNGAKPSKLTSQDIESMSNEKFAELEAKVRRQLYQ